MDIRRKNMASYRENENVSILGLFLAFVIFAKTCPLFFSVLRKDEPMLERNYQAKLIKKLYAMFPEGTVVLKNDANYLQGFPDLLILHGDKWAALETKKDRDAKHQPNQDYYVDMLDHMSYAAFIFPENEEEILHEVQRALEPGG